MKTLAEVGAQIDASLKKSGVTLTAGGEPTLIADNHEHAEWNVAALGPTKLAHARRLVSAMMDRLAPGALITHTMGKQYPGEPIPRWSVNIHWRRDGKPLAPKKLFRLEQTKVQEPAWAKKLMTAVAAEMGLAGRFYPAYEDPGPILQEIAPYYVVSKGRYEVPKLTPELKKKLAPLQKPTGWILPLDRKKGAWKTVSWNFRNPTEIILWPGLSPMGLRLPLHRLPPEASRKALTIEVRNGELAVFIPPMETLEDYLDIFEDVRKCAERLKAGPLVIEGYAPPREDILTTMGFVADPGVLEINLPPSADQAGYETYVKALYEAAPSAGLRTYKYQYTGRKIGTGGGAHILLGGPTPEESPVFTVPHLLPSLVRFIQHHPSLSYVFTGLFVGPSSQAPRVDESEYEVPYEMEIALRGVEKMQSPVNKNLLDLMVRNLLMDTLGNTHRAEISVDKLWNPYAPNGCLGLIEFRAFEMPPKADMLLAAVALLRGLAAFLVKKPFHEPLKRWGYHLHDTYSMPYFLEKDFREVLAILNKGGFDFEWAHFSAWFEFRFPMLGHLCHEGREIEFRQAVEPWPVLAEQPNGGGTTRFVDASTDRLQITIPDLAWAENYLLLANGTPLSFTVEAGADRKVGTVRYRMYYCVPGLQPHINAQSPLVFELVDRKTFRVVAAKKLLNWRPDQQNYAGLPQSDAEARRRVTERFKEAPETVCELRYISQKAKPFEALYTTDLRFFAQ
jgi:uncharacterized protein (DUF2126 family)